MKPNMKRNMKQLPIRWRSNAPFTLARWLLLESLATGDQLEFAGMADRWYVVRRHGRSVDTVALVHRTTIEPMIGAGLVKYAEPWDKQTPLLTAYTISVRGREQLRRWTAEQRAATSKAR